jgi:arginyl-tRNA synthetase
VYSKILGNSAILAIMEEKIRDIVGQKLEKLGAGQVPFVVEWPADPAHGDFAVNAAMAAYARLRKQGVDHEGKNRKAKDIEALHIGETRDDSWSSSKEIAEILAKTLCVELGDEVSSVEVAGPGFINITLSQKGVESILSTARTAPKEWGRNKNRLNERVIIEYSNPNPFKEMHIGHLMSTIVGESISRLIEFSGAIVFRDTYGGDVGPHVAKTLWALTKKNNLSPVSAKELGDAYALGSRAYEEDESAKKDIDVLNTKIYEVLSKEEATLTKEERDLIFLWRNGREVSVLAYRDLWSALGTSFDYVFFESETTLIGTRIVKDALMQGVFKESEGAVIYDGEKKGLHTLVFITSRGTPTYETKDIGLAFLKEERIETDFSYVVTASEQIGHFNVFLSALQEIAPTLAQKTKHVAHGLLRLSSGKMSSREGNIITAEGLIEKVIGETNKKNEDPLISKDVALGAIKYMILRQQIGSDTIFDIDRALSFEGDSGPYIQYAVVRAMTILSQAKTLEEDAISEMPEIPYTLSRLIIRFPEMVHKAQVLQSPHVITQYITVLASEFNSFYAQERILGGEYEMHKLQVVEAFITTMKNGMWLLGISVPDRM